MTGQAKVEANRRNAQKSTGPRTQAGLLKSSRNATSHGLSIPLVIQPELSARAEEFAMRLRDTGMGAVQAARVAFATIELARVSELRELLRRQALDAVRVENAERDVTEGDVAALALGRIASKLLKLDRYERRAMAAQRVAARASDA